MVHISDSSTQLELAGLRSVKLKKKITEFQGNKEMKQKLPLRGMHQPWKALSGPAMADSFPGAKQVCRRAWKSRCNNNASSLLKCTKMLPLTVPLLIYLCLLHLTLPHTAQL